MNIDSHTYYSLIGLIVVLSAILMGVIISYFISLKKLSKLEKKETEIINAAQEQAAKIISQANQIHDSSGQSLHNALSSLEKIEETQLTNISHATVEEFGKKMEELNFNNIRELTNISQEIKNAISFHFDELKRLMAQQTVDARKEADEKIKGEYDALEKNLAAYKQQQLDKINRNIYQILLNVSKSVFGTRLDIKEHEQMIIDALAQAEQQAELQ